MIVHFGHVIAVLGFLLPPTLALEYKGCFNENPADRSVAHGPVGTTTDVEECYALCIDSGFTVSAVNADHECFCDNSYGELHRAPFDCECGEVEAEQLASRLQSGDARRRRNQSDEVVCVYAEECCQENTSECSACRMNSTEESFCQLAGAEYPGCARFCDTHPEIVGCNGGTCYRNERDEGCLDECPEGTRFVRQEDNWFACNAITCEEEYACEVEETKELCSYSDEEASAHWSFDYFVKWGRFPNDAQQAAFEEMLESEEFQQLDAVLKVMYDDMDPEQRSMWDSAWSDDATDRALALAGKTAGYAALGKLAVYMAARHTAAAAAYSMANLTGLTIGQALFHSAMGAFWEGAAQTWTYSTAASTASYFGIWAGVVVSSYVAEIGAGVVMDFFGLENRQIIAAATLAASVGAGAVIGSWVGPIGTAGGAAIGAGYWTVSEAVNALFRIGKGPGWNWVYLETGYLGGDESDERVSFYSYNKSDKLYLIAYDRKHFSSYDDDCFSAGQDVDDFFQVEVETTSSNAAHFNEVWHRDLIRVAKSGPNQVCTIHCHGELWESSAGLCIKKFALLI